MSSRGPSCVEEGGDGGGCGPAGNCAADMVGEYMMVCKVEDRDVSKYMYGGRVL